MDISEIKETTWDYILVGGGLSASVVSHRLFEFNPKLKILVVEAGPNANDRPDIVWPNSTNLMGGDFDWKYKTVQQPHLNGRQIDLPSGKALGGGTTINNNGWVRGDRVDYDLWGSKVNDARWSYDGLLPFMKKSENFQGENINKQQRGTDGPSFIQSVISTNRQFPLRNHALQSWAEIGVEALPGLDANAGNAIGVGDLQENKVNGRREIASAVYSLDGVAVLTETLVEKVLTNKTAEDISAVGIKLESGVEIRGHEIIVSAGAVRTPQILMLSGIGPAEELNKFKIPVVLDQPEVGKNLIDHTIFHHAWKVKNPADGWALGSNNPVFAKPQYGWGSPMDFLATTDVPKEGLVAAITEDEGSTPDPLTHPLLNQKRAFVENIFMYAGGPDGSLVSLALVMLLTTSRGSVKLASDSIRDHPLVDPNYLSTAVDRYAIREGLKMQIRYAGSDATIIGREILDGEKGVPGFDQVLSTESTDGDIDARLRAGVGTCFHPMGTAAMGSVIDTNLRVKGIKNLRVVDTSVFPVAITGHLQVATFALAEQAAEIIYADRRE
ncbi:Pyranose dehydrogenase 3 [Daldinia childiae]|uniref:Pyranose dehydrogenase 3 n=1 Tax=Daldinia childiae TaxID=326645 RepID=UPI0014460031|nr:Pyranose dehydrogenase 3 [Daldinia childiae]KAF3055887.1 Pyranose dehydrogenase 3 [Daldinia childiae]